MTRPRPPARLWERGQLAATVADTGARIRAHELVTDRVELSSTAQAFLWVSLLSTFATPYATQLIGHANAVYSVAFSPDGHTLASASDDHTARLWNVSDPYHPSPLGILTGHTNGVDSVAFGPDGHTVATASGDNTARLWDANVDGVAARICAITWPAITKSEWDHFLPGLAYRPPCS